MAQSGQLIAGSTAVPVSPICLRRMKSFQACVQRSTRRQKREARHREVLARQVLTGMALRVGGEPEREVFMCAGEGLAEEVRWPS